MTTTATPATPKVVTAGASQFVLEADLVSILGGLTGGYLRITLCGFGPILPWVLITAPITAPPLMLADAGVPQLVGPQDVSAAPLQIALYCNSLITPGGNFYEIAMLDKNKNVIQCGNYQFNTVGATVNLAIAAQIVGPYGFSLGSLQYLPCTGSGSNYVAPGKSVIAVSYNGILLVRGQALPTLSYTVAAGTTNITLNFATESGDRIDAFVVT
jgi:hypothetical protein